MIKNIFFDVMGVVFVVGDDTNELLVPFVQKYNKDISREQINKYYSDASLGIISSDEFWLKTGIEKSRLKTIRNKYLDENLVLDPGIIDVITVLKDRRYKIGFLSNDVSEWSEYLRKKFDLDTLLDYCVISGDVGLRKPDEAIYEYTIRECDVDPRESVFIDDRIKNLIPAEKLGFKTVLFDRNRRNKANAYCHTVDNVGELIRVIESIDNKAK